MIISKPTCTHTHTAREVRQLAPSNERQRGHPNPSRRTTNNCATCLCQLVYSGLEVSCWGQVEEDRVLLRPDQTITTVHVGV